MPQPFTFDQMRRYGEGLVQPGAVISGFCAAIVGAVIQHITGAPALWRALFMLASVGFVMDMFTGLMVSKIMGRVKHGDADPCGPRGFNSRDFGHTISKFIVYGGMFLIATLIDLSLTVGISSPKCLYNISTFALGLIGWREVWSNIENYKLIADAGHIPWPFAPLEAIIRRIFKVAISAAKSAADTSAETLAADDTKPNSSTDDQTGV